ncbi:AAA family ATPase [Candidatus Saccharibacteria bacterium]|nr:AAA family ATPase [Candidatus Saccharibacteria bacterium]
MYLKRITIVGFKSFANKTVLDLEPGMTAVVGPNGSGKSNVADAIRWALGEQSKSRLRLGDREEVVFAGSDKRARASLAEVVLVFNNDAGTFPLDVTEVEISRRLYRSGETEYRLAGRPVKLGDLQQLLAEAGFGVGSYAVIGQGTIDSLLLSSPAERKLLFDEAAGIRGPELSREASLRKLAATEANLVRLRDIAAELSPRLAVIERSKEAHLEQERLSGRIADLKLSIIATANHELALRRRQQTADTTHLERASHQLRHQLTAAQHAQASQLNAARHVEATIAVARKAISELETRRDGAAQTLGSAQALLAQTLLEASSSDDLKQRSRRLTAELTELESAMRDIRDELAANHLSAKRATAAIEAAAVLVATAQSELVEVRQQLSDGTRSAYVSHALSLVKAMARELEAESVDSETMRLLVYKTGRLLNHASRTGESDLASRLKGAQSKLESTMAKRDTATEHQTNITLSRRSLELEEIGLGREAVHAAAELETVTRQLVAAQDHHTATEERRQAVTVAEADLVHLTSELVAARQSHIDAAATPAADIADAAARLERLRAEASTADRALASTRSLEADLTARQHHYDQLARRWGIATAKGNAGAQPLASQEETLGRLEGELAARIQLGHDLKVEYDDVTTRQFELTTQIADLEAAKADLEAMVIKLAGVIGDRFRANFERLDAEFGRQAARLFDGGSAGLSLVEDDTGEYGIQIKLSPKGKRLGSLAALSGGERAMAGVALLAAILVVNPSPFVVLDEIDAALDDANSGRLADIMEELATKSQLIVITHNRQTMKAARVLFGVTMNEHHVSYLLSLHLEQATQLAAR